jgi:hypothetical protein
MIAEELKDIGEEKEWEECEFRLEKTTKQRLERNNE